MSDHADSLPVEPTRAAVDALPGTLLLEFGASWCGHCQAAQPVVQDWLTDTGGITHLKIEDGKGRPLGRSFAVKLWPTLVLLDGGRELARVVRPTRASDLAPLRLALQATQGRATR